MLINIKEMQWLLKRLRYLKKKLEHPEKDRVIKSPLTVRLSVYMSLDNKNN